MRLQHNETRLSHPLSLPAANELIDDALRSVVEISKLSLPDNQSIRIRHWVTQFKSWKSGYEYFFKHTLAYLKLADKRYVAIITKNTVFW